jgi:hypothetical protein
VEWIAATDQPFDTTETPEFRALIEYVYHVKTPIPIPGRFVVQSWIMKMGEDTMGKLQKLITVSCARCVALDLGAHVFNLGAQREGFHFPQCMDIVKWYCLH